jgi:hypothetical protein
MFLIEKGNFLMNRCLEGFGAGGEVKICWLRELFGEEDYLKKSSFNNNSGGVEN